MSETGHVGMEGYAPEIAIGAGNPEALKYGEMWKHQEYRKVAPGEQLAQVFLQIVRPRPGALVADYGCGTGRGALALALFGGCNVTMIDFVRNSLDDDIVPMLETQKHALRFIKADLEKGPLPPGEYGYCTDVMEHIPPARVDLVLNNILCAARHCFFSISFVDDSCGALIGQPLHLTVKPYAWWLDKFRARGCTLHYAKDLGSSGLFYVTAWSTAEQVSEGAKLTAAEEALLDNVRANVGLQHAEGRPDWRWRQALPHPPNPDVDEVMIVGGGPSLDRFEKEIRRKKEAGIKLVTLNGAYNWALTRGLAPVTTVVVDGRPFNARFVRPVREDCLYLISSQCHPSVLEGLPPERTWLWHTSLETQGQVIGEAYPEGWYWIQGGSTVLLRAIPLLSLFGFSRFSLYGCDSCLSKTGEYEYQHHAFEQPENDSDVVIATQVTADGRTVPVTATEARIFYCHPWMISQANQLVDFMRSPLSDGIELDIKGDGLLAHILKVMAEAGEVLA